MPRHPARAFVVLALVACSGRPAERTTVQKSTEVALSSLVEGQRARGFRAEAVYLDAAGARMGARLVHEATGFTFDALFIETAPQAFVWVNSFPTSDKGEPHTQEHLLLGKGNKGRQVASVEAMSRAESSAFTMQWRTCYHFHTIAGAGVFWDVLEHRLDGLLHPDYTDEEIRREVRNFGVVEDPDTKALRLEEKGTVYNEMVRSYESPNRRVFDRLGRMIYGEQHPLALSSGGRPEAIREMTPADIRAFHARSYHLGNMGMVAAFPRTLSLDEILARTDAILTRQGDREGRAQSPDELPAPAPVGEDLFTLVPYPHASADRPGQVTFAWPAVRTLSGAEQLLLELFLDSFAGDASSNLYRRLVASESRTLDSGATGVWSYLGPDRGHPVYIGITDVRASMLDEAGARALRDQVTAELAQIAAWAPDAPALVAFNERLRSRLTSMRRRFAKMVGSPPRFGIRGTGSGWMQHLDDLAQGGGFERALTAEPWLDEITRILAAPGNPWRERLARWGLLDTVPMAAAAIADPALLARDASERQARIAAEVARLRRHYGKDDDQVALRAYRADYDRNTAALEAAAAAQPLPAFIDEPPMTLDDGLRWRRTDIAGVPAVLSDFDSMPGGRVGLAFAIRGVPEARLPYLAALPGLMTAVGVRTTEGTISYQDMLERLRREILSLAVYVDSNPHSGRLELVIAGAGNDEAETRRALEWIARVARGPDLHPDNLPRIRDAVDQMARALRSRMLGAEEGWVDDPARTYAYQDRPLLAHATSFLTRAHDVHRLRWLLRAAPADEATARALAGYLEALGDAAEAGRDALRALTGDDSAGPALAPLRTRYRNLPADARSLADEAHRDLRELLPELPDGSLAADWRYLCTQLASDLARPPTEVLAELDEARQTVLRRGHLRVFAAGAPHIHEALRAELAALIEGFEPGSAAPQTYTAERFVDARLRARDPRATAPVFVGLVNPSSASGVFVNRAPLTDLTGRTDDALLDHLTSNLYSGHGAHSMFMKTWSAGLAYSNGLRGAVERGHIRYYAERCPELPQTLAFVIAELERAEAEQALVRYAIAESFDSRIAHDFDSRAEAMAADLADGITPELVRDFRQAILDLRARHGDALAATLFARLPAVYGRVLPGYGPRSREVDGGVFFVIGPHTQLQRYREYLTRAEGPDATLFELYPRDFWLPPRP